MYFILVVLFLAFLIVLILFIYRNKQIFSIIGQLEKYTTGQKYFSLSIGLQSKTIERLAADINQIIEMQEKMQLSTIHDEQKLKQSIADISHDLRTPLTSILGYLQLIQTSFVLPEPQKEYLQVIEQKAKLLHSMIHDFYELSVLDSENYTVLIETINITSIVSNVLLGNYAAFQKRGITPQLSVPKRAILIDSNRTSCERILQNMITNSIRYTTGDISVLLSQNDKYAIFTVANQADTLSKEQISHIFERFYTGDASRSQGNTGLGLYIVKALLLKVNGKILDVSFQKQRLKISIGFPLST